MKNTKFLLILFLFIFVYAEAKTYSLYIASTKYKEVSRKYIEEINDILQIENLIVRTHLKKNYSVIVRKIESIKKAKELQKFLSENSVYKDSYIKRFDKEPSYFILYETIKSSTGKQVVKQIKKDQEDYKHTVESSNEYITASTMYNIGNYKKAYFLFTKLFYKYNYNINVNYFLAQSALRVKKYDEASAALERILIQKPDFHKVRYEYAKTLFRLKLKDEAKKEFNILINKNIKKETKEEIKKYLKVLNKKRKYSYGSANILLGVGRSSNVNNGLITQQYRLPALDDLVVSGEKPISDSFHEEAVSLTFSNISKKYPTIRLQNSIFTYNKSYFNEKDENTTVFGYKPNLSYIQNNKLYSLELLANRVNRVNRKNNESFNVYSISPSIQNKDFQIELNYQRIAYLSNENNEKNFKRLDLSYSYNILKNLKLYIQKSKVTREKELRIDIDKKIRILGFNWFYRFNNENMVKLDYELGLSKYKYENILFESKRKDKNHFLNLAYIYTFDTQNRLVMSSSFTKNNSNQDAYIYEEIEAKINYLKQFKW